MRDLLTMAALVLAAILLYRFHPQILAVLKRFDQRNVARIREERLDRQDRLAHFKHTLKLAEEQVEEVSEFETSDERTGEAVTRYLFEGETFLARKDAEDARADKIRAIARNYYMELPAALAHRGKEKLH